MKTRNITLLILVLVFIDQIIKVYIKTHFYYGEEHKVFGLNWFRFHFLENPGMAWSWKFGQGDIAKLALTTFRLGAVIWGSFYIAKIIRRKSHPGFIISVAFIYAGALGNLIDSFFYGLIFEKSDPVTHNIAHAFSPDRGYAGLMFGQVVDMWYFPIFVGKLPEWIPLWGGNDFEFFQPVFNTADIWVSTGVTTILIFQKRYFWKGNKSLDRGSL